MDRKNAGYLMILTAGLLWSTIGLFSALLSRCGAEPRLIAFVRIGAAALLLVPIMFCRGGWRSFHMDKRGLVLCALLGIFSQALFNVMYSLCIERTGVALGAVLLYTSPVFVALMSRMFLGEKLTTRKIAALAVDIVGCVLTVTGGRFVGVAFSAVGVAAGIAAAFLYAASTVVNSVALRDHEPFGMMFYSFFFGALALGLTTHPFAAAAAVWSPRFALLGLGYGLVPTVMSYYFYMNGLARGLETSKVPIFASVELVAAALIGFFVFSENFNVGKAIGILLVIVSIVAVNGGASADSGSGTGNRPQSAPSAD